MRGQEGSICGASNVDPDRWFMPPDSVVTAWAKRQCLQCDFYWQCQEYALSEGIPHGVFGGMDERDRAQYWARHGGRPTKFLDLIDSTVDVGRKQRGVA